MVTSPSHSRTDSSATISTSATVIDSSVAKDVSTAETTEEPQSAAMPPAPVLPHGETHIITTDSMVTVRLSDAEGLRSLPSPTPTLKLVTDEDTEEDPTRDSTPEPVFTDAEQTESPIAVTPSRRFSVSSAESESESESQRKGVDWEGLERTEDEHSTNDEESEEVRPHHFTMNTLFNFSEETANHSPFFLF